MRRFNCDFISPLCPLRVGMPCKEFKIGRVVGPVKAPDRRPVEGVNYVDVETWERISMEPVLKVFEEARTEAEKGKKR